MARAENPIVAAFSARPRSGTAVLVGEFFTAAPFPHFAAAMRDDGWDVHEIDLREHMGSSGLRWMHRIADRLVPQAKANALAAAVEAMVANVGADVVLFAKGMGATPALIHRLGARGCKSVCWYPDRDFDHAGVDRDALALFDLFITTKPHQMDHLRAVRGDKPTILIEHGWSPGVHGPIDPPVPPAARPFDVIFIGNHSPYKQRWMAALAARCPEARIAIAGHNWPRDAAFPPSVTLGGPLVGQAMARAIGHARIGIAVHHGPDARHGWEDAVSVRSFEIPACGTFMLHIDNDHIRTLFDVPGEIDVFADDDALAAKVMHYLAHPDEREAIAARGTARALRDYSYAVSGRAISAAIRTHVNPSADKGQPT